MTREQVLERIIDPHGPPTDLAERRDFDAWLERDEELRKAFEQQRALFGAMNGWRTEEPSIGFDRGVWAKIAADEANRSGWRGWLIPSWKPAIVAGAAAAALLIGGYLWNPRPEAPEPPQYAVKTVPAAAKDAEYIEELDRALDDLEMLTDFDAFLAENGPEGRS